MNMPIVPAAFELPAFDLPTMPSMTEPIEEEATTEEKLTDLQRAFRERRKVEQKRFEDATDSEYWFAVCFQSREQKEQFLKALQWMQFGDKYLDGTQIAEALGIELQPEDRKFIMAKVDAKLTEISLPLP